MEIINARQITPQEIDKQNFDVFIFAHSGDARWSQLNQNFPVHAGRRILLLLKDFEDFFPEGKTGVIDLSRTEIYKLKSTDNKGFFEFFESVLRETESIQPKILVDISCFPRQWIGALLNCMFITNLDRSEAHILLAYFPSSFYMPPRIKKVREANLLMDFEWSKKRDLPVALLMILGYDNHAAQNLIDRLKPDKVVALYTAPDFDKRITEEIEKRHKKLIASLPPSQVITYPLQNLHKVNAVFTSEILRYRLTHKVYIAVMGPKILTALSLVLQIRYPDVEVWDPGDIDLHPNPVPSAFPPLLYYLHFEQTEDF